MAQRVSYGACGQCGGPVIYQGAEYCSPACYGLAYGQRRCVTCGVPIELTQQKQVCKFCDARSEAGGDRGACPGAKDTIAGADMPASPGAVEVSSPFASELASRRCERCGQRIPQDTFLNLCAVCEHDTFSLRDDREPSRCELCGELVEAQGEVCQKCEAQIPRSSRSILSFDLETELIRDDCAAPPIVCAGFAGAESFWLFDRTRARQPVEGALRSDHLIVGHHVAYDMVCVCAEWPDLIPLVFDAYDADRVTDTMLREKLVDIAVGSYIDGREYPLETVARSRCGIALDKTWQLRFGELRDLPLESWPEDARKYVSGDVVSTLVVYQEQERDKRWFADQYRQARAAFALELMSAWGLHTDPVAVRTYKLKLETKFASLAEEMVRYGLMRRQSTRKKKSGLVETKLVRTTKAVQERVASAYTANKKQIPMTAPSSKHSRGQVRTDADTCGRSGDAVLKQYADISSTSTLLSTYVPVLERASVHPLHARFTSLLATGRTSTSPNTQNYPTEQGVRECFVPRPGWVYIVSDYAGIELRTWAQICYSLFGESKMREALNAGIDPHTLLAAKILGISYEQTVEEYAHDRKGRVYMPRQASKAGNFGFAGGAGYERWREYARTNYGVDVPLEDPDPNVITAKRVKYFWREAWTENEKYADWCQAQCGDGLGRVEQVMVGRFRGGLRYTEVANGLFQGLAADLFKDALFRVARACYSERGSPLFGSRPVNEVHDELVTETPDNQNAHDAAREQERLMLEAAKKFLPDITNIQCETLLARRWSKAAKPVFGPDGRLIPWDLEKKT